MIKLDGIRVCIHLPVLILQPSPGKGDPLRRRDLGVVTGDSHEAAGSQHVEPILTADFEVHRAALHLTLGGTEPGLNDVKRGEGIEHHLTRSMILAAILVLVSVVFYLTTRWYDAKIAAM